MIIFALGFALGAFCLQQLAILPGLEAAWILASSLAIFIIFRHFKYYLLARLAILLLAAALGFGWATILAQLRLADELPAEWQQKTIALEGVVASVPQRDERGERFRFDVEKTLTENARVPRHISLSRYYQNMAEDDAQTLFHAGERWVVNVRLKRPHGTYNPHAFDFEAWALAENMRATGSIKTKSGYQKLQNLVWKPAYLVEAAREKIGDYISRVLTDKPYAGVIRALVVGDDSAVTQADWQMFLRTGTNHLVSISGLHITMLSGLVFGLAAFLWRRFPPLVLRMPTRKVATIVGALTAIFYAALAGWSVPTQRTLLMLLTFAVALMWGRRVGIAQVLACALFVVTLLDPWAVIAPGFWLSFGAVAAIAFVTVNRLQIAGWLRNAALSQWAVSVGLLPFLVAMFGQISLVAPLANALAIPLISLIVVPLAIAGGLLHVDALLQLAHGALHLCMLFLDNLAHWPLATWQQAAAPAWAIILALLGVVWLLLPRGFPQRWLGALLLLPMLLVKSPAVPQGALFVGVLDVGQGLAVVLQTAHHSLLYDAGPRYSAQSDAGARIVVPYLRGRGIRHVDGVVLSHDDTDHSGGASAVLAQVPVRWLLSSFEFAYQTQINLKQLSCATGQGWQWDGVRFEVLWPASHSYQDAEISDNNRSCVIKVSSAFGTILLTGDIEKEAELSMLEANQEALSSDVVIVPHHGSKTSSTPEFVQAADPKWAVMTVGYLNRFRHPKSWVEGRYTDVGAQVYRSDYHGALEICLCQTPLQAPQSWRLVRPRYWQDKFLN